MSTTSPDDPAMLHKIIHSDCRHVFGRLPRRSIDAVITSPPYADKRKCQYNSVSESDYPSWTVAWMRGLIPILKASGSVAVVIRSHVRGGSVSPYLLQTRLALRADGWVEPEELLWLKPDSMPTAPNNRPRRSWEHVLWFARQDHLRDLYCDPKANGRESSRIGPGRNNYRDQRKLVELDGISRSKDYVEVRLDQNARGNKHPAQYPVPLARWIIRLLTPEGGLVLDPFCGSGSTSVACVLEGRRSISIDSKEEYIQMARARLHTAQQLRVV